jgi:hypothetical protein
MFYPGEIHHIDNNFNKYLYLKKLHKVGTYPLSGIYFLHFQLFYLKFHQ